jgi:hypothetical protein
MAKGAMQQAMGVPNGACRQGPAVFAAFAQQLGVKLVQVNWPKLLNANGP